MEAPGVQTAHGAGGQPQQREVEELDGMVEAVAPQKTEDGREALEGAEMEKPMTEATREGMMASPSMSSR